MIIELTAEHFSYASELLLTLAQLSRVEALSEVKFRQLVEKMLAQDKHMFLKIVEGRVVSTVSVYIEYKLTRGGALAAHVEDVATAKGMEGRGYASELLRHIQAYAQSRGCYKLVLHCKEPLVDFYIKSGFVRSGANMRLSLSE